MEKYVKYADHLRHTRKTNRRKVGQVGKVIGESKDQALYIILWPYSKTPAYYMKSLMVDVSEEEAQKYFLTLLKEGLDESITIDGHIDPAIYGIYPLPK